MDLPKITRDNQWDCRWCAKRYVIPMLARDCEDRHEEQEKAERESA